MRHAYVCNFRNICECEILLTWYQNIVYNVIAKMYLIYSPDDKGKPAEKQGRKAKGSKARLSGLGQPGCRSGLFKYLVVNSKLRFEMSSS